MSSFHDRFHRLGDTLSPFCLGIDPAPAALAAAGLPDDAEGLRRFCAALVDAAAGLTAVVKPQMAFFERFGPEGLRELQRAIDAARERGLLVLLDGKRGDIGSTCQGYADAFFGPARPYRADAVTASPYLGFQALAPLLEGAADVGGAVFVVVKSSNPEGAAIQTARVATSGRTVAETLASEIAAFNGRKPSPVAGAVLGATGADELEPFVAALAGSLVLAPGIGHQGGSFEALAKPFRTARQTLMPTMSRTILAAGFGAEALRRSVAAAADEAARFRRQGRSEQRG